MYQVDVGYACAGVVVDGGVVHSAAPIFKWMVGKQWAEVQKWTRIVRITRVGE